MSTTIENHATMAPAADILRYLLGRPRTQQRVMGCRGERAAFKRLRDSGISLLLRRLGGHHEEA